MIFYFSGTGNSAWAARQLAKRTGDVACDITTLKELPDLGSNRQIGFVFPIYAWGAPEIMVEFAKKLPKTQAFTFGVCTCGADAGLALKQFSKVYPLSSSYSLVMPNNYILGSDTDEEGEIRQKIAAARAELERISGEIQRQEKVYRVHEGGRPDLVSLCEFRVQQICPKRQALLCRGQLQRLRPVCEKLPGPRHYPPGWQARLGGTVLSCLRCTTMSTAAIQYGKSTAGRRRYTIRGYLPQDEQ